MQFPIKVNKTPAKCLIRHNVGHERERKKKKRKKKTIILMKRVNKKKRRKRDKCLQAQVQAHQFRQKSWQNATYFFRKVISFHSIFALPQREFELTARRKYGRCTTSERTFE